MIFKEHFSNTDKSIENIIIEYIKIYFCRFLESKK